MLVCIYVRPTRVRKSVCMIQQVNRHVYIHRLRLVKKIGGGQKFGSQILGGGAKILGKFIFRQKIFKMFPSILSKISDELFFSNRQLFLKIYTFHSKCT